MIDRRGSVMRAACVAFVALVVASACGSSGGGEVVKATRDEYLRACVTASVCLQQPVGPACAAMFDATPEQLRCAAAVGGDCDAWNACFGRVITADPTCEAGESCSGDTRRDCEGGELLEEDCDVRGLTCVETETTATCSAGQCEPPNCVEPSSWCEGELVVECCFGDGLLSAVDCGRYGQTCTESGDRPHCGDGDEATCTAPRCDGDSLLLCLHGYETAYDCGRHVADRSCHTSPFPFCGFDAVCSPNAMSSCDGATVEFCFLGEQVSVDCTELGFSDCSFTGNVTGNLCVE